MKKTIKIFTIIFMTILSVNISNVFAKPNTSSKLPDKEVSKNFKKIASGVSQINSGGNNIIFKKNKNAYVIGYNGDGGMGYGDEWITGGVDLKANKIGENVYNVYASNTLVAFTKKNKVYFCGSGFGGEFYKHWNRHYKTKEYSVKINKMWLSNGTLVFGKGNDLYLNGLARTGGDIDTGMQKKPKRILENRLNKIKDVTVSSRYVVVHYKNGKADIMGMDEDLRNLDVNISKSNKCIRERGKSGIKDSPNYYKKLVPLKQFNKGVKKYVAGWLNIGAIKENGDFYIWGSDFGLLGVKPLEKSYYKPKLMLKNVKDVSMGYRYALALKKDGTVWAWGYNDGYAISEKHKNEELILKPIKIASNVKKISTGSTFSVILKKNGKAYWKGTIEGNP